MKFGSGFNIALVLHAGIVMGEVIMSPCGCRIFVSDSGSEKKRFRNIHLFFDALHQLTIFGSCDHRSGCRILLLMVMHYLVNSEVSSVCIGRCSMVLTCPVTTYSLNVKVLLNFIDVNLLFTGAGIRNIRSLWRQHLRVICLVILMIVVFQILFLLVLPVGIVLGLLQAFFSVSKTLGVYSHLVLALIASLFSDLVMGSEIAQNLANTSVDCCRLFVCFTSVTLEVTNKQFPGHIHILMSYWLAHHKKREIWFEFLDFLALS